MAREHPMLPETPMSGPLRNGNPRGNPHAAPRRQDPRRRRVPPAGDGQRPLPAARRGQHRPAHRGRPRGARRRPHHARQYSAEARRFLAAINALLRSGEG